MNYHEIRILLKAYWEAESTLEQEHRLKEFFATAPDGLPQDLAAARDWFLGLRRAARTSFPVPESFLEIPVPRRIPTAAPMGSFWLRHWEYAAILLIAAGSFWVHPNPAHPARNPASVTDTYQDPRKAYEVTKQALELLSANLNRAKEPVSKIALLGAAESKIIAR